MKRALKAALLALTVLIVAGLGSCYEYQRWWWRNAQQQLATAVRSVATGKQSTDLTVLVDSTIPDVDRAEFTRPYRLADGNMFLVDPTYFGALVSPGSWVTTLTFNSGHSYELEIQRQEKTWIVWIKRPKT